MWSIMGYWGGLRWGLRKGGDDEDEEEEEVEESFFLLGGWCWDEKSDRGEEKGTLGGCFCGCDGNVSYVVRREKEEG